MAIKILKKTGNQAVIQCDATETLSVNSLKAANTEPDLSKVSFTSLYWTGTWVVTQGSDTIVKLSTAGYWPLSEKGIALETATANNVTFTLTGAGSLIAEISKKKG